MLITRTLITEYYSQNTTSSLNGHNFSSVDPIPDDVLKLQFGDGEPLDFLIGVPLLENDSERANLSELRLSSQVACVQLLKKVRYNYANLSEQI